MPRPIGKKVARARAAKLLREPANEIPYFEKGGGKRSFTQEVCDKILEQVKAGDKPIVACRIAGIWGSTLADWVKRAESGDPRYLEFIEALRRAEAEAESRRRALVELAARGGKIPRYQVDANGNPAVDAKGHRIVVAYDEPDAKAAQWLLERGSSRSRWGNVSRLELTGKNGQSLPMNFAGWTKDDLLHYSQTGERPDGTTDVEPVGTPTQVEDALERLLNG